MTVYKVFKPHSAEEKDSLNINDITVYNNYDARVCSHGQSLTWSAVMCHVPRGAQMNRQELLPAAILAPLQLGRTCSTYVLLTVLHSVNTFHL